MDLNKHIVKNENDNPLHSSGIAAIANGSQLGVTSTVSFNQRQQINRNRQVIGGYQRSKLGGISTEPQTNEDKDKEQTLRTHLQVPERSRLQQHNATPSTVRQFTEPSSRGYNPYS